MKLQRSSGILMHISSLPSPYGIGTLGKEAFRFVDFLKKSGQHYWQVLPLGPTSYGDSPYQSFSVFAGNPYFIDLELLCQEGLLTPEECQSYDWGDDPEQVDYEKIFHSRFLILEKAFQRSQETKQVAAFRKKHTDWIEDYALYMAIKEEMNLAAWKDWDEEIRLRKPDALTKYQVRLKERINFYIYLQYKFYQQYYRLKQYANRNQVKLIGDIPIYVAEDSADTWANTSLFYYDKECHPIDVAGCPPDAFSATGQLWGNPLYRWDKMKLDGFQWWLRRIRAVTQMYDLTRIDHFRGFESYYAIPAQDLTAEFGEWRKGPGMALFQAIREELGEIDLIAEDLGFITPEVRQLREDAGYPGMKIMQFAFDSRDESDYLPHNCNPDSVIYTGTHDNDTVGGWYHTAPAADVAHAMDYLNIRDQEEFHWDFIRGAWSSVCDLAIAQMQDFLGLDSSARMNTPSTLGNNWQWRMQAGAASDALAKKIFHLTKLYCRYVRPAKKDKRKLVVKSKTPPTSTPEPKINPVPMVELKMGNYK